MACETWGEVHCALQRRPVSQCPPYPLTTQANPIGKLATWPFLDIVFSQQTDNFNSMTRLRRAGFAGMCVNSGEMLLRQLEHLRKARIIP